MKFRFRVLNSPKKLTASQSKKLRFAGKGGLRKIRPLPEPVEKINLNDTDFPKKKKKRLARSRLSGMFARIGKCLSRAFTAIGLRIKRVVNAISARLTARSKRKKIRSLPVLAGALTASVLVLTLTASCLLFGLFYRYARSYETVVIPSFTGKTPESADYDAEKFNLIIKLIFSISSKHCC